MSHVRALTSDTFNAKNIPIINRHLLCDANIQFYKAFHSSKADKSKSEKITQKVLHLALKTCAMLRTKTSN